MNIYYYYYYESYDYILLGLLPLDGNIRFGNSFLASLVHLIQTKQINQNSILLSVPSKPTNDQEMVFYSY